jgi:hypothetical protein
MSALSRLASIPLRVGEIGFAAVCGVPYDDISIELTYQVVAGVIGHYLQTLPNNKSPEPRFIYIEVITGISLLLGLMWLLPFSGSFFHWPMDILLAFAWFTTFGLLIYYAKSQEQSCAAFD